MLGRSVFLGSTLISLAVGASAYAETTSEKDDATTVSQIVITGSRIKRDAFTSPDPITVISNESATLAGFSDTASLLQQSSVGANSFQTNDQLTGYIVEGGPGAKTLNLRRLGAQRSIILIDGKRVGPAGVGGTVGPVDLNVVPREIIDRIEVLKDGASSIYGSDAVAGVVNIITKHKNDGAVFTLNTNQSEHGNGNAFTLSGDWGHTFNKGYVELGAEYYEQDILRRGQRDYTACAADYLFDPSTGARIDYAADPATYNYGQTYKCYNATNNDIATTTAGTLQYLQPGVVYPGAALGNNVTSNVASRLGGPLNTFFARQARAGYPATYPYANYSSPLTNRASTVYPDRHDNFSANFGYDFNAYAHGYGQFLYSERVTTQIGARQLFPSLGSAWIAGNPNNILFGTGVTPVYPIIERPSDYSQDVKYLRAVVGLKGDFKNLGWFDRFNYDVSATYSKSDADYTFDAIYNDRVVATTTSASACNPATVNLSNFSCAGLPASGIPWLSQRVVSGQFTQAESDFLFFKTHGTTTYEQYIGEAVVSGALFNLPAGPLQSSFGVTYRHDEINDTPDPQTQAGNLWGQTAAGHTAGSDAVKEAFAELQIPIVKNLPFIRSLDLTASGRYSDYDSYGSTGTYKYALNWTVSPDIRFRGSIGSSFRAPALYELYLAHQTGFLSQASIDPCVNYGSSGVSATIQAACAALGIPGAYTGASPNGGGGSATISTGGGIGNLKAETSISKDVGVVFTPKNLGPLSWANLDLTVDYFTFQVSNEVATFGSGNIITQCLQGNAAFCTLFNRDLNPSSPSYLNILTVNNNYVNVASQGVRGIDVELRGNHTFGKWGKVSFDSNLTWTTTDKTRLLGDSGITNYNGGTFNYDAPAFAGNASLTWELGNTKVYWYTSAIGKGSDTAFIGYDTNYNSRYYNVPADNTTQQTYYAYHTAARIYHDVSVTQKFPAWNVRATVGLRNLFDESPPAVSTGEFRIGTSAIGNYDMIGRQLFLTVSKAW